MRVKLKWYLNSCAADERMWVDQESVNETKDEDTKMIFCPSNLKDPLELNFIL